jgi:4'-phosphopantetheinyl transferase
LVPEPWGTRGEAADNVSVWTATLNRSEGERTAWESTLSPDELARANRFHFVKDRDHYVVARGLLRKLLGEYLHQDPRKLEFTYGPYGRPELSGAAAASGASFNLAHSGGLAAYAISRGRNLGIDVERIQAESAGEDIARRYFSTREVSDLQSLPPKEKVAAFFRCWTRKEAYLKALGTGLQTPLDSFSVSLLPDQPALFLEGVTPDWRMETFQPAGGYAGAVVYSGLPCTVRYFSISG